MNAHRKALVVLMVLIFAVATVVPLAVTARSMRRGRGLPPAHAEIVAATPEHHHVLLLHWTPLAGLPVAPHAEMCSATVSFSVTANRRALSSASAIVFSNSVSDMRSSSSSSSGGFPETRDPARPWVLRNALPPGDPRAAVDVRSSRALARFNLSLSYRTDADGFRPFSSMLAWRELRAPPQVPFAERSSTLAAWFRDSAFDFAVGAVGNASSSSSSSPTEEEEAEAAAATMPTVAFATELTELLPADIVDIGNGSAALARFKFALCVEPACCEDYVGPAFFRALRLGVVPVVLGAPNIASFAPAPGSYIDAADFASPAALAAFLRELAADQARYEQYLAWKKLPDSAFSWSFRLLFDTPRYYCRLAVRVLEATRRLRVSGIETHPTPDLSCRSCFHSSSSLRQQLQHNLPR